MARKTDKEFYQELHDYLAKFSEGLEPTVPVFKKNDDSLDREKILALPCFADSGIQANG